MPPDIIQSRTFYRQVPFISWTAGELRLRPAARQWAGRRMAEALPCPAALAPLHQHTRGQTGGKLGHVNAWDMDKCIFILHLM